jgi:hypothetical protein
MGAFQQQDQLSASRPEPSQEKGGKAFCIILALAALGTLFAAGLPAQLIEPTRAHPDGQSAAARLSVFSEPPGMEVRVDGQPLGKTPVFSARLPPGPHVLRVALSETEIHLASGTHAAFSWFKDAFVEIPETSTRPAAIAPGPQPPPAKPEADEPPGDRPQAPESPYYWPLNPRGPIR